MTFLATGIMIASLTVSSIDSPVTYDEIVDEATYNCKNANWEKVDRKFLWTLVDIEKKHGVPASMRGMILSSACMESGYNRHARGDWRTVKRRGKNVRVSKALGIFQM